MERAPPPPPPSQTQGGGDRHRQCPNPSPRHTDVGPSRPLGAIFASTTGGLPASPVTMWCQTNTVAPTPQQPSQQHARGRVRGPTAAATHPPMTPTGAHPTTTSGPHPQQTRRLNCSATHLGARTRLCAAHRAAPHDEQGAGQHPSTCERPQYPHLPPLPSLPCGPATTTQARSNATTESPHPPPHPSAAHPTLPTMDHACATWRTHERATMRPTASPRRFQRASPSPQR